MVKSPLLLKNVFIKVHLNIRNICYMSIRATHCFLCRKVWDLLNDYSLWPVGMLNKQEMVEASNKTRLRVTRSRRFHTGYRLTNVRC